MSLITDIIKNTVKMTGDNFRVTEGVTGENLFIEASTVQLQARVDITNRATIIGDYLPADPLLLSSRKIDVFKDASDMLSKTQQYASGSIAGKTVDDAVEVLVQYICLSENNCTNAAIILSDLFTQSAIPPHLFEKIFFAVDYALRKNLTNPVLKMHAEKVLLALYSQMGQRDARAAELMQVSQKIGQMTYQDTPLWSQDYAAFMVNAIEKIALREGGNLDEVLQITKEDYKRSPQDAVKKLAVVSLYIAHAMRFSSARQFERAIKFLEKALKIDPEEHKAKLLLASYLNELSAQYLIAKRVDKYQEVIAAQERVIQLNPNFGRAYHNLAVALWLSKPNEPDLERIIRLFEKNLSINPGDSVTKPELVRAYDTLGGIYMQGKISGKSELDVLELMEKAIVLAPDDVNIQSGFVSVCCMIAFKCLQGQFPGKTVEDGERYLTKGIEFHDKELLTQSKELLASVCNQYAVAFTNGVIPNKSHMEAIALLEVAISLMPSLAQTKENLFYLYGLYTQQCILELNKGNDTVYQLTQAIKALESAIILKPDDVDCQALLKKLKNVQR